MIRRPARIGRHIVRAMVIVTVTSVLLAVFGMYLFYSIALNHAPELLDGRRPGAPGPVEWGAILLLCGGAILLAIPVAMGLTRRIIPPVVSVAEAARRIADGELSARADPGAHAPDEGRMMVQDFNQLAERLERASEAVTRWNASIAHELRTPVTILSGRLQGMADGVFATDPPMLRSLLGQVDALARLIEDLRTVSLFEGGRLDVRHERVMLADEIAATVRLMQPALEAAGFRIETRLDAGLCDIDRGRIRQAMIALLENARRHANPGRILVQLTLGPERVRLGITDEGPGLPAEFAPYAFEPFRQLMESNSGSKGLGLGLAVVRAIAEAHGGTAGYRLTEDGADFHLDLPRRQLAD